MYTRKNQKEMKANKRLSTIDGIRGITIVSMILYHFCWDLVYICGFPMAWYGSYGAYLWQQSICYSFILISGFCLNLSRRPVRNGCLVFGCGLLVTAVTLVAMPDEPVICGVLTLLGSCMLILAVCKPVLEKIPPLAGLFCSLFLFLFFRHVNSGYLGFFGRPLIRLPESLYSGWISTYFGFPKPGFVSSDYFSLLPWLFLYLTGYFIYRCTGLADGRVPHPYLTVKIPVFDWIGRHSLLIYMLHQVVLYGIAMAILFILQA